MVTIRLNVGKMDQSIAKLAAEYHGCQLIIFAMETGPGGKHSAAWFQCPDLLTANALVATLFNFKKPEGSDAMIQ